MKVTVIGSGYVGLVTGACLADLGNDVVCLDVDRNKIELLQQGIIPIHEPGLDAIIDRCVKLGKLRFTCDTSLSVAHGDIQIIAVGTPSAEDGSADMQYVLSAAKTIGSLMTTAKIIVDKSTVPVGTADKVAAVVAEQLTSRCVDIKFDVVSNPEFLKEGVAITDFKNPDRIVIGTNDGDAFIELARMYGMNYDNPKLIQMDTRSAELTKYAANAMLATRISFMNELANLAEKVGANINAIKAGIGSDSRIGSQFLNAGCGYGGSCFPKDVKALQQTAADYSVDLKVVNAVSQANDAQKFVLLRKIIAKYGTNLQGLRFAILGLAFKPDTDDMREAPSVTLMTHLLMNGATLCVYDPVAMNECKRIFGDRERLHYAPNQYIALDGVHAAIIVTEWSDFKKMEMSSFKTRMKTPVIFDGRNIFNKSVMQYSNSVEYHGIGQ